MFSVDSLSVSVGNRNILNNISYVFEKGKTYIMMGPNGSGKSTFAFALMGHPHYQTGKISRIFFNSKDITNLSPDRRAKTGLFLSFQNPVSVTGVTVLQMLRVALKGKKDALHIQKEIEKYAKKLNIKQDLLKRSIHDGLSGGEKKKIEILQAAILDPAVCIFDEIDTGVDIDSLHTISRFMRTFKKGRIIILITHNSKITRYVNADKVIVLKNGSIAQTGNSTLIKNIEDNGFSSL